MVGDNNGVEFFRLFFREVFFILVGLKKKWVGRVVKDSGSFFRDRFS